MCNDDLGCGRSIVLLVPLDCSEGLSERVVLVAAEQLNNTRETGSLGGADRCRGEKMELGAGGGSFRARRNGKCSITLSLREILIQPWES